MTELCHSSPVRRLSHPAVLIAGILMIAMNLRAPFTSIAPLLERLQAALGFNATAAGLLMILPLLAFVVASPWVPRLARHVGLERSVFLALLAIAAGIVLRVQGNTLALYVGIALIGAGIAVGNVLLPSLVKRSFPRHIALLTSCYVLTMGIMAAIASAVMVPLAQDSADGWQFAMLIVVILPVVTMVVWWPQLSHRSLPTAAKEAEKVAEKGAARPVRQAAVWHSPLAWQVTLFMGINSLLFYTVNSWLPSMLADNGFSPEKAGSLHGLLQLASALPGLILVPLMPRLKDQRLIAFATPCMSLAGFIGLWLMPGWALVWVLLLGASSGASFILALSFMGLRARDAMQSASLSSMAQTLGYLLAAMGPPLIGALYDRQGDWQLALMVCASLSVLMAGIGWLAGRDRQLPEASASE
ncbi:MFS transporter [Cobetia sp. 14N.309.X.WAT.E.A4]|uniref:MFS transporter n=1 Tax=Cobetia sp. 14N.309.X.WAT.E.A4 TaxID=2998323 RepID=UPI0025B15ACE|nr:MFS transporter [Cobetia sp. 14N.309.X.WAT.E.A4]MDN2657007.1 MFS transporter [Cobetia sp. 14N.309.X.WAT.E.A4]